MATDIIQGSGASATGRNTRKSPIDAIRELINDTIISIANVKGTVAIALEKVEHEECEHEAAGALYLALAEMERTKLALAGFDNRDDSELAPSAVNPDAPSSVARVCASHNRGFVDTEKLARCTGAVTMAVDVLNQFHGDAEGMRHIIGGLMLAREGLLELGDTLAVPRVPTPAGGEAPASVAADAEAPATLSELKSAVRAMDRHSQVAFEGIEALAEVAEAALTEGDSTKVRTHLRALMASISYKAQDTMNEINSTAEGVGCNYKEDREVAHG